MGRLPAAAALATAGAWPPVDALMLPARAPQFLRARAGRFLQGITFCGPTWRASQRVSEPLGRPFAPGAGQARRTRPPRRFREAFLWGFGFEARGLVARSRLQKPEAGAAEATFSAASAAMASDREKVLRSM